MVEVEKDKKEVKKEILSYPTDDIYFIAAINGLLGIDPDSVVTTEVGENSYKAMAIYNDRSKLLSPSAIYICSGDKKITLRDFKEIFIKTKREFLRISDERKNADVKE